MTCRAPSSSTTCVGSSPTGAQLSYDNEGQLVAWQNAPSSPTSTTADLYDGQGNRAASQVTQGARPPPPSTLATTGGATTTYTYDQADRLLTASGGGVSSSYTYNGDGVRVAATTGTTTVAYQWDPGTGALLSDGANEYVDNASGGLLVQTPTAGGASAAAFGVPDALGSTRILTNGSGQTQATYAYDAFNHVTEQLGFKNQKDFEKAFSSADDEIGRFGVPKHERNGQHIGQEHNYKSWSLDYDPEKGAHFNWQTGKGASAYREAAKFPGDEEMVMNMLVRYHEGGIRGMLEW